MRNFAHILSAAFILALVFSCGEPKSGPETPETVSLSVPANVRLNRDTDHSLIYQWDAVSKAESYDWKLTQGSSEAKSGTTKNTTAIIDGLTKGVTYQFTVRAVAGSSSSSWSSAVEGIPGGAPAPDPGPTPDPDPTPDTPVPDAVYQQFLIPSSEDGDKLARAFPGAEGGGMYVTGGRGGQVIHVTNTNDSGAGSLRAALTASGKRIVVFDVAGTIALNSAIQIKNGDLTIAGQTAPGGGICIKNYTINIAANNVIIRYLHFRLGDEGPNAGDGEDCIWGRYQKNIILDHCSMSWSIDECASFYANENFTLQWCILTESMNNSAHSKGAPGYGGIWGGKNASFHHNLLSNHHSRNPRIDHPEIYPKSGDTFDWSKRGNVDLRNLVVYNWGDNSSYGGEGGKFNFVNCWYKPGPDSKDRHYFVDAYKNYTRGDKTVVDYGYPLLYMNGNVNTKYSDISSNNAAGIYWHNGGTGTVQGTAHVIAGPSGEAVYTTTHAAEAGKDAVLAYAGDRLHRDAVDTRAVDGVKNNTGKIIDTPVDVGGWPEYKATPEELAKLADGDNDNIPDWFERQFGLDMTKDDASVVWLDKNGRYTNFEMYLHYLVKDIVAGGNTGGAYTKL